MGSNRNGQAVKKSSKKDNGGDRMPANFPRVKDWVAEVLTYTDLNAEIDNILNHLDPDGVGDYSVNAAQMQVQTRPYAGGVLSLPNSLAGELERLRYQINAIMGSTTFWYEPPIATLSALAALAEGAPNSRLDSLANGLLSLVPHGTLANVSTAGVINYHVDSAAYATTGALSLTGLASAAGGTCLVNDATYTSQQSTQLAGEHGTVIKVDTVNANITATAGTLQGYKVVNGGSTEYFIGEYTTDPLLGTCIARARRGLFFNSATNAIPRISLADNNVITLCRLHWIFLTSSLTLTSTPNAPTYSHDAPTAPSIGDYWFDLSGSPNGSGLNWQVYTPGGWVTSSATFLGMVIVDGSAAVGARAADPFQYYNDKNEIDLMLVDGSTTDIKMKNYGGKLNVYARTVSFGFRNKTWSTSTDLVSGSVAANTTYYCYVTDYNGGTNSSDQVLSTIAPHDRRGDLGGFYYPSANWRCVGYFTTNGSSQILIGSIVAFSRTAERFFFSNSFPAANLNQRTLTTNTTMIAEDEYVIIGTLTGSSVYTLLTAVGITGKRIRFYRTDSSAFTFRIAAAGAEVINGVTANNCWINSQYDYLELISNGTSWDITLNKVKVHCYATPQVPTGTINTSVNAVAFTPTGDTLAAYSATTFSLYTIYYEGLYAVSATLGFTGASAAVGQYYAASVTIGSTLMAENFNVIDVINRVSKTVNVSITVRCVPGDLVYVGARSAVTSPAYSGSLAGSTFSISRVG